MANDELSRHIVKHQSEDVVLNEKRISSWLQDEVLHEGLGDVIVGLELTENIYKNAAVEHWLTIDGGDEVGDLLELQASKFFHYFRRTLHLLSFERH